MGVGLKVMNPHYKISRSVFLLPFLPFSFFNPVVSFCHVRAGTPAACTTTEHSVCAHTSVVKQRCEKQPVSKLFDMCHAQVFCRAIVFRLDWQSKTLNGCAMSICTASEFVRWVCQDRPQNLLVMLFSKPFGALLAKMSIERVERGFVPWQQRWWLRNLVSGRTMLQVGGGSIICKFSHTTGS